MGNGTRFDKGVIDGQRHIEEGSATLVAGATTVTVSLASIRSAFASNMATNKLSPSISWSGTSLTITVDGSATHKVTYLAVGPRTTNYATSELV